MIKAIGVDFDNTIAEYSGWTSADDVGDPFPNAISFLTALNQMGLEVYIFSARALDPKGKRAIEDWVKKYANGLVKGVTSEKLGVFDVIVDDRAIYFNGDYKEVLKEIIRRGSQ